jgi:uncharacterized protein (DUF58 family)
MTPRPRLLILLAVAGLPLVAAAWFPRATELALVLNLIVTAIAVADIALTPAPRTIVITREVSEVFSVGVPNPVTLRANNQSRRDLDVELFDEPPPLGAADALPVRARLTPWKELDRKYHFEPHRRGLQKFTAVHVRYPSVVGLWHRVERRPLESVVRVYPDIRAVRRFDLLARRNRLSEIGLKLYRLRGRGGEFERLREYRREDELRHVDWKATAKHERLISREFTVERNQNILILLDCGRSMCNVTDGISHFDRSLNAAIILSYIALGQGDNVALMAFSNRVERAVGPVRGKPAIQAIIRQTYDLEPRLEASDYSLACEELLRRQRKRALVILVTHSIDEQHVMTIGTYARTLVSPHILLCVFLRDVPLDSLASSVPVHDIDAFHTAAAAELLATHAHHMAKLRELGAFVLECTPAQLSSEVINEYLALKARHLL